MAETRQLGGLTRALLSVGVAAVLGLASALVVIAKTRSLDHRVHVLVTETSTKPDSLSDSAAWNSKRAAVYRVTDQQTLDLEEAWFGEPTTEDRRFPERLLPEENRILHDDSNGPERSVAMSRILVFSEVDASPLSFGEESCIALIESDLVFRHVTDYEAHGYDEGAYPCGRLVDVKARVAHVRALRLAFDEVKKRNRSDLIEAFLGSHVSRARKAVIDHLATDPEHALSVFRGFLADDAQLDGHRDVIDAIAKMNHPGVASELTAHLERELTYWTAVAPMLGPDWFWKAPKDEPRTLRRHYSTTYSTLNALVERHEESCRGTVRRFLTLQKSLPPDGVPYYLDVHYMHLATACERIRRALNEP